MNMKLLLVLSVCVVHLCLASNAKTSGEISALNDLENTVEGRFHAAKKYFLKHLNQTVTDVVDKGFADVKMLASQGFQAFILNYMNAKQQLEQQSTRDLSDDINAQTYLMDRIHIVLETFRQNIHRADINTVGQFDDVTSDFDRLLEEAQFIVDQIENITNGHVSYLDKFLLSVITEVERRVMEHHRQGNTAFCPQCFTSVSQSTAQLLKPMVNGLELLVTKAAHMLTDTVSEICDAVDEHLNDVAGGSLLDSKTIDQLQENILKDMESTKHYITNIQ